jgi:hypothetical protein
LWRLVELPKPAANAHVQEIIAQTRAVTQPRGLDLLAESLRKAEPQNYRKAIPAAQAYQPDVQNLLNKIG